MNPFNPQAPISPVLFYGREGIIDTFKYNVKEAVESKPTNMALVGEFAIGKTSLLQKLFSLDLQSILKIFIMLNEDDCQSFSDFSKCVLSSLEQETKTFNLPLEIKDIDLTYIRIGKKEKRVIQFFTDKLMDIWKKAKSKGIGLIIIFIDDYYLTNKFPMQIRNCFQDLNRKGAKYMIIMTTTPEYLRTGTITDPIKRFYETHNLDEFSRNDTKNMIKSIIKKSNLKIKISEWVLDEIHGKTDGHPYFITLFMRELIKETEEGDIDKSVYNKIFPVIISKLKINLDNHYVNITDKEEFIIKKILGLRKSVFSPGDIETKAKLSKGLNSLIEKDVLERLSRGKYKLYHPLLKDYFRARFK